MANGDLGVFKVIVNQQQSVHELEDENVIAQHLKMEGDIAQENRLINRCAILVRCIDGSCAVVV